MTNKKIEVEKVECALAINDIHAGSSHSISVEGVELNEGHFENPNKFQKGLLKIFENKLDLVFDELKGRKFGLILGGEMLDGINKRNPYVKQLINDQIRIAGAVVSKITDRCDEDQLASTLLMEGTEWHEGIGNDFTKMFADANKWPLKIRKNNKSSLTWQEALVEFPNGAEMHCTHHFNETKIYPGTGYLREYKETIFNCHRHGYKAPDMFYRCHIHKWGCFPLETNPLTNFGVYTLPGWQGKNQYVQKGLARLNPVMELGLALMDMVDDKVTLKPFISTLNPYDEIRVRL